MERIHWADGIDLLSDLGANDRFDICGTCIYI
jgi:hypothetical protein